MPNEFFARRSAAGKFNCEERNRNMIWTIKIAVTVLGLVYFGAEFGSGSLRAAEGNAASYRAQAAGGPASTGQRLPPAAASPLPQGKSRDDPAKDEKPAAPSKSDPVKPFEPTEKVKADQALDFPADI
jgi:hypothetical protein